QAVQRAVLTPYGLPVNEAWDVAPDPYGAAKWKLLDADSDGKHDAAWSGPAVLLDPKQKIALPITKAPIAFVRSGARAWCILDGLKTLASEDLGSGAVTIGEATGQGMLSLALDGLDAAEKKRATNAMRRLWPRMVLHGSPWPDPVADVGSDVMAEESGLKGLEYAMVSVVGTDASSMIFELDRDALSPSPGEMEKRARKGQGVDMAWVRRSQTEWFFYDTDHDGAFDVVLFLPPAGEVEGFRVSGGRVVRARDLDA